MGDLEAWSPKSLKMVYSAFSLGGFDPFSLSVLRCTEDKTKCEASDEHNDDSIFTIDVIPPALHASRASLVYDEYLRTREAIQIHERFQSIIFEPGGQVMWTGVPREWAQKWADERKMQTLSTAMGPLFRKHHPSCQKTKMSREEWSKYVKGASRIFALYVPKNHEITVLTQPPPSRFNPTGLSTFQSIEEPILKGVHGGASVSRIDVVHITVAAATDFRYQIWPEDETHMWTRRKKLQR